MTVTHYRGSRGLMAIDEMPYPYLLNARDKLLRECSGPDRQDEIDAMTARIDFLDAERRAAEAAAKQEPSPDDIEAALASAELGDF